MAQQPPPIMPLPTDSRRPRRKYEGWLWLALFLLLSFLLHLGVGWESKDWNLLGMPSLTSATPAPGEVEVVLGPASAAPHSAPMQSAKPVTPTQPALKQPPAAPDRRERAPISSPAKPQTQSQGRDETPITQPTSPSKPDTTSAPMPPNAAPPSAAGEPIAPLTPTHSAPIAQTIPTPEPVPLVPRSPGTLLQNPNHAPLPRIAQEVPSPDKSVPIANPTAAPAAPTPAPIATPIPPPTKAATPTPVPVATPTPAPIAEAPRNKIKLNRGIPFGALTGLSNALPPGEGVGPDGQPKGVQSGYDAKGVFHVFLARPTAVSLGLTPAHIVYVLDVSGSMSQENKIGLAREALRTAVNELLPDDYFTFITFSNHPTKYTDDLVRASKFNMSTLETNVDLVQPDGETDLSDALDAALSMTGVTHIFLISDGVPTIGITQRDLLLAHIRQHNPNAEIHISVFALGTEEEFEGVQLLHDIADANAGEYRYINDNQGSLSDTKRLVHHKDK